MSPNTTAALQAAILRDLSAGQSTADSIALRLKMPTALCEKLCKSLQKSNQLETLTIAQTLTVYRLK